MSMTVFADSFYFLAVLNPRDTAHERAVEMSRSLRRPLLTTAWVLIEVGDAFARDNREAFLDLLELLRSNPFLRRSHTMTRSTIRNFSLAPTLMMQGWR
jgi:hypothetical protein